MSCGRNPLFPVSRSVPSPGRAQHPARNEDRPAAYCGPGRHPGAPGTGEPCAGDPERSAVPLLSPPRHKARASGRETPLAPNPLRFLGTRAAGRLRALRPGGEGESSAPTHKHGGLQRIFLQNRHTHKAPPRGGSPSAPALRRCASCPPRSSPLNRVRPGRAGPGGEAWAPHTGTAVGTGRGRASPLRGLPRRGAWRGRNGPSCRRSRERGPTRSRAGGSSAAPRSPWGSAVPGVPRESRPRGQGRRARAAQGSGGRAGGPSPPPLRERSAVARGGGGEDDFMPPERCEFRSSSCRRCHRRRDVGVK